MASPLYLTADEKKLFEALPKELTKEWTVEEERLRFEDSPEKLALRMKNVELHDPKLVALKEKAASAQTQADWEALPKDVNFADANEEDLMELYFAMGPSMLSIFIEESFKHANAQGVMLNIVALSAVRHILLQSLNLTSASA
jgi:hypothetical protein